MPAIDQPFVGIYIPKFPPEIESHMDWTAERYRFICQYNTRAKGIKDYNVIICSHGFIHLKVL